MRICVCVKEVPPSSVSLRLDPGSGRLVRTRGRINGPDDHAIEQALQLREQHGEGEVVVLSMAPPHAADALRHALAMGADRAVLIADEALSGSDLVATSRVLAAALARERPDLVLFGWEGTDSNGAMLWAAVAERLGMPVLSRAWRVDVADGVVRARRQMEYGFDVAEAPLPAAVALSGAINAPRYPSLKGVVASKRQPVEALTLADLGLGGDTAGAAGSRTRVLAVDRPPARTPGVLIEGAEGAAERLVEHLASRGLL
jgi:electron transfer flavoprotein beta subunit